MVIHNKFLNANLFLIKTFLITKFDCILKIVGFKESSTLPAKGTWASTAIIFERYNIEKWKYWNKNSNNIHYLFKYWVRIDKYVVLIQTKIIVYMSCGELLYSHEQKHMLLFRKSEILLFKVSITYMPHILLGTQLFCF